MGPSGGGKSTVVNLVERFYDPSKGAVLLDGVQLPDINHEHLHTQARDSALCLSILSFCTSLQCSGLSHPPCLWRRYHAAREQSCGHSPCIGQNQ